MTTHPTVNVATADLSGKEREYLLEAFDSGWISGSGPFVDRLEHGIGTYLSVDHALACANGTVALHLALMALGIGPGDEVVVPSLTYIATANAVTYCGATPVFADCDPETWNITRETIEPLLTERTRAVIVVHLYGNPVEMDPILALARDRGIFVVEDAAEAHGATYQGRRVGGLGDIGTLSFYGNKLMTTGEGGMVLTNNPQFASRMKLLRGQGMDPERRYWFPIVGYNYRLTNLQCAIGLAQFERLEEFIETRRSLAKLYGSLLYGLNGARFQVEKPGNRSVNWMSNIVFADEARRTAVVAALTAAGIETRPLFQPLHLMPPYRHLAADCPIAEDLGRGGLSLPSGGHIDDDTAGRIAGIITDTLW